MIDVVWLRVEALIEPRLARDKSLGKCVVKALPFRIGDVDVKGGQAYRNAVLRLWTSG